MLGPAGLTWLAVDTGGWGWLPVAALFVAAGLLAGPAVEWTTRTPRLGAPPVLTDSAPIGPVTAAEATS
jgi:hypothetical protein